MRVSGWMTEVSPIWGLPLHDPSYSNGVFQKFHFILVIYASGLIKLEKLDFIVEINELVFWLIDQTFPTVYVTHSLGVRNRQANNNGGDAIWTA